jgi:CheY-like chemotaxis protein
VRQGLETIERNARLQTQLIEDLLDMSRIVTGQLRLDMQRVDLKSVIEAALEAARPAAEAKGIALQAALDPLAGAVSGDPSRLQQVCWNLLSNAVKFTPGGGSVQVSLQRVGSQAEIVASDSGQGIHAEFLPHVFERFRQEDASTTRRHGGLGLGLGIVKHLVELHGGTVRVDSAGEGQGATFTVSLPLAAVHDASLPEKRRHAQSDGQSAADCPPGLRGLKVLVVDDEPDARDLVTRLLHECGVQVITAESTAQALRFLQSEQPAVLLSDIGMPGEDGYELIRRVRALEAQQGGTIPAIALTAFARAQDRSRALLSGFQMHLSKPVEPAELIAVVATVAGLTDNASPDTTVR